MRTLHTPFLAVAATLMLTSPVWADGGIQYNDIALDPASGLQYARTASARNAAFEQLKQQPTYTFPDVLVTPLKPRGAPGVAIFDYDGDGDQDIYVTNGPGSPNSLFENQFSQTGTATFVDVGLASGADVTNQDSNGVCVGDIDNDGDEDIYVLGSSEPNVLLENQGNGAFVDITASSSTGAGDLEAASCTMADIDNDGLLDIFVGNTFDLSVQFAIFADPFNFNQRNQLFRNTGGNQFADVSVSSNIQATEGFNPPADSPATISWAVLAMDYDGDGDIDLIHGDDQAAVPFIASGNPMAQDRGFIQIHANDGNGNFTNVTEEAGTTTTGQWMGLSAGDVNCDGSLEIFGSNFGDYTALGLEPNYPFERSTSRFYVNNGDGTMTDPASSLVDGASVFGWGTSMYDYDNDGDLDILYHGGLDLGPYVEATNPGVLLQNQGDCSGSFVYDGAATSQTDHLRRTVHGMAIGDLNNDGFDDVVSVSAFDMPAPLPVVNFGKVYNSPFDASSFVPTFAPTNDPGVFVYTGLTFPDGTISVELSDGANGNHSAQISLRGSVGTLSNGRINRDGVGATVSFTPRHKETVSRPVMAGSSYASTDAKVLTFGMGSKQRGTVDVHWPGGVKNRLYNVRKGEHLTFPEIPCSYDTDDGFFTYYRCTKKALRSLKQQGVITGVMRARLFVGALRAYFEEHC